MVETFVAAVVFIFASAMGLVMIMAPSFTWFQLLKMQWPLVFRLSALRMTLLCLLPTIVTSVLLSDQHDSAVLAQLKLWFLTALGWTLLATPLFWWHAHYSMKGNDHG